MNTKKYTNRLFSLVILLWTGSAVAQELTPAVNAEVASSTPYTLDFGAGIAQPAPPVTAKENEASLKATAAQWLEKNNESGFLENRGQMMDMENNPVPFVLFKAEAPGLNLWITESGMTLQTLNWRKEPLTGKELEEWESAGGEHSGMKNTKKYLDWERIDVELKGASIKKENITKEGASVTDFNFFYHTCPDGIYGVKEYEKITVREVYPGIDWVVYNSPDKGYKYDFVVHPGADYSQIELLYKSKTPIRINEQGELELYTQHGNVKENSPVSFYEGKEIQTRFKQNYQKNIHNYEDKGFETSISFNLNSKFKIQN